MTTDLIPSFISIPIAQANNIDQLIGNAETVLANANANAIIQTLQQLSSLTSIATGINFTSLISDLQTTSQTIQNTVLENLYSLHCQDLSANTLVGPENWLQRGFAYVESKKASNETNIYCPFCKQSIDTNSDILNAYTSKFNADFNALIQRLQTHLKSLQNFNLEATIQAINNIKKTNASRIASWTTHLPSTVPPPVFNIITDEANLRTEFQNLIASVQQKIQNPTVAVSIDTATAFQTSVQIINANIVSYNIDAAAYNTELTTFLSNIQTVATAQLEVDRLKRIKKRFGGYWNNHFSTIGIIGMNEALLNFAPIKDNIASPAGKKFAIEIMDYMREQIMNYQNKTNHLYNLEATPAEGTSRRLSRADKDKYPNIIVANEEAVKSGKVSPYYTNSSQLPVNYSDDLFEALDLQDNIQVKYTGGTVFHSFIGEAISSAESVKKIVKKIANNYHMPYFTITPTFSICPKHGYLAGEHHYCPKCDEENGYYGNNQAGGKAVLRDKKQINIARSKDIFDNLERDIISAIA